MNFTIFQYLVCALALMLADIIACGLTFVSFAQDKVSIQNFLVLMTPWLIWFGLFRRCYFKRQPFWEDLLELIKGICTFIMFGCFFALQQGESLQVLAQACWWGLLVLFSVVFSRGLVRRVLNWAGVWRRQAIIFGVGENAQQAALAMLSERSLGFTVEAFVYPRDVAVPLQTAGVTYKSWPQKDVDFNMLRKFHCVIALEANQSELRDLLIMRLSQHRIKNISVIPSMRGVPLFGLETTNFFSHELLMINVRNNLINPIYLFIKRLFDFIGAIILIIMLSPLMLWVSYKIWRTDGGPVIFSQIRVGKDLQNFKFYKFRSMVKNAEDILKHWENTNSSEWQEYTAKNFKIASDPRLINIGALIRRTSIDELPQLFNVLIGDMSLVGPRPLLLREQTDYGDALSLYAQTRPGLTGLWQISGRSKTTFQDRIAFDMWYVKNWSLWTDITILFKTWSVVFNRSGAF